MWTTTGVHATAEGGPPSGPFHLKKTGGRDCLIDPYGRPFLSLGVNHVRAIQDKGNPDIFTEKFDRDWEKACVTVHANLKRWGFNTAGYGSPTPLCRMMPYMAPVYLTKNANYLPDKAFFYPDVFDPEVQKKIEEQLRHLVRTNRDNTNLIGYYWTDTPQWDLARARRKRGADWVSTIREMPADAPGKKRYEDFVADCRREGRAAVDEGFLRLIARELYRVIGKETRRLAPDTLVFGERYLAGDHPDCVLEEALPYIDVLSIQPGGAEFDASYFDRLHARFRKPILLCDHQCSFATPEHPKTMWQQLENEEAVGRAYALYLKDAFAKPYIVGYHRCQYIDRFVAHPGVLKQGMLRQNGTPYKTLAQHISRANAEAKKRFAETVIEPAQVEIPFPTYPKPAKGKKNLRNYGRQNRDTISEILYGEPEKAEAYFRDYLREHPKDLESEYGLVLALTAQGRTDEALGFLKSSIDHGLPFSRYMAGPRNLFASIYKTETYRAMHWRLATPIIQGPMVGATGSDFVSVWVRTDSEREMTLQVAKDSDFSAIVGEQAGRSSAADDYTAVTRISGLKPSTTYFYRFVTDGAEVKPDARQSFTTFPEKGGKFSIAFGGGAGYAPEHERMWDTLRSHELTAILLLGDNVYIDWPEIPETQRYCYYRRQSRPEFRKLVATTPTFAIYDDHDFGKDDAWGSPDPNHPAWKRPALKVFSENWANPSYGGGKENPGCWFNTSIGGVDFFLMDCRYYRDDKRVSKPGKTMLGACQKAELKKALLASTATFKVICSTVPMGYKIKAKNEFCDTWDGYDEERREIFKFLDDNKIEGVFILAADRHRSDARVIEREGGYPLYEFMSSRLTNQIRHGRSGRGLLFCYNEKCSFGKISFDLTVDDPTATYDVVTIDNETVHSFTLKRSQLK